MRKEVIVLMLGILLVAIPLVSAGVGLKWDSESVVANENEKVCMTYSVYNPWPEESMTKISLSEELKGVLTEQKTESTIVPANTASADAIPVKFCFKVPRVYSRDCWIGGYICRQECQEEQKLYSGQVIVSSVPQNSQISGAGGSGTTMSVSAPLRIRVACNAHGRDFTLIYAALAVVAGVIVIILVIKKLRKTGRKK